MRLMMVTVLLLAIPTALPSLAVSFLEEEHVLQKVEGYIKLIEGDVPCGDYFVFTVDTREGDGRSRIVFSLRLGGKDNLVAIFHFLPEKFAVVVDDKVAVPTVSITGSAGKEKIFVHISRRDYEKAPCLPRAFKENLSQHSLV